ncbi:DNA-methyltransferase [Mycoplasma zalophidermidis]|uniref:DNA-methyltransferase n=1 Tax=Mycoplasma zalophidermidis TaxID=398174 RepID=UPI00215BF6C4|nr:site-specific DNA-methyltransferase [Mycoplasma zalophidermidis]MCR8966395.1 site-specific DNA-methyltransferase [Mycoplasma zalophidermidis]
MELNKIYNIDVIDFLKDIKDNSVDLIIADPPYNQNIDKWDIFEGEKKYFDFMHKWLDLAISKLKKTGSIYLFNNAYNSALLLTYLIKKGMLFKNSIIWYKKDGFSPSTTKYVNNQETIIFLTKSNNYTFNYDDIRTEYTSLDRMKTAVKKGILKNGKRWYPNPNGKLCTDVWEIPSVRMSNKVNGRTTKTIHPTPKPEKMIERIIKASSNKGDLILDLFSGSGITSLVAKKQERKFIGCDLNKEYVDIINKQLLDI